MLRITGIVLLLGVAVGMAAQRPYQRLHELFSGREDYRVECILQDSTGLLWFGTDRGLFRYDGFSFERFTVADGLADDRISSLCRIHSDLLWIGHNGGSISEFDGREFRAFAPEEGLGKVTVTDIAVGASGSIWFSTMGEGLFRYDGRYLANFDVEDGLSDNYVYDIEIDRGGGLWLATDYGISHFARDTFERISTKDGLPDNIVRTLEMKEDILWLGTDESGISSYDPISAAIVNYPGWSFGTVSGIAVEHGRHVWVSTEREGLIEVEIGEDGIPAYRQISEKEGLISNRLNTVIRDSEENLWIGGRRGIVQMLPPLFEFLGKESGLPFERANSLWKDHRENVWVCSEKGLFRGSPNASGQLDWENISERLGLGGLSFVSVYEDPAFSIWAGSLGGGLVIIDPQNMTFRLVDKSNGLTEDNIINISGFGQKVWISTLGGGVIKYDLSQQQFTQYNQSALKGNYIYSTLVDPEERVWIAAPLEHPHYILDDSLFALADSSFAVPALYGTAIDTSGQVWFNTLSDGILRLGDRAIEQLGPEQGVDFQEIQSIVFDRHNRLLIFANRGLQILDTERGTSIYLDEQSGLGYRYPVLNSVHTDRTGKIWFGTNTGIIRYNPDYLYIADQEPRVFLSTLRLFDSSVDRDRTRYPHRSNNFTFGYTGLWYKNPGMLTFRYQLEGYDLDWNYYDRNRVLNYPRLSPGQYAFRVEVSIDGLHWNPPEDGPYSFRIVPPFWKRWWFILGLLVLGILGVILYIRLRLAGLERAKKILEDQVRRRTEQIANKNLELESQKALIASQRDLAEEQRDQIRHQRDEIQSSISYARRIQSAAQPPEPVMKELLSDYFIFNRPRSIVSGDFYWAAMGGSCIYFAVADCTGHGVPGAFLSMLGISSLNEIVKSQNNMPAGEVLDHLAKRVRESLHQTSKVSEDPSIDGLDIALCSFDPAKMMVEFAGANNHLYLVRNGNLQVIRADRQDISSKYVHPRPFRNRRLEVREGDVVYLFSDGFPDQFGGPERKKYKYGKFRNLLVNIHRESMEKQQELLGKEFDRWKGDHEQIDDVLVLGVRIHQV